MSGKRGHDRFFDFGLTFIEPVTLEPRRTALVVIDMQYSDAAAGRGYCLAMERIQPGSCAYYTARLESLVVPQLAHLVEQAREREIAIVYLCLGSQYRDLRDMPPRMRGWIRAVEERSGVEDIFWAGNPDYAVLAELSPKAGDTIIHKPTFGAFNSTTIDQTLRAMGRDTLLITGVTTNACVETTARDAADRGFATVLIDECMADHDQEAHDATLRAFHFSFGPVMRSADDVLAAIDQGLTIETSQGRGERDEPAGKRRVT